MIGHLGILTSVTSGAIKENVVDGKEFQRRIVSEAKHVVLILTVMILEVEDASKTNSYQK